MSFAAEIQRRKVLRVAVAYFFTGVAVLEAGSLVLPSLFLPSWVYDTLVAIVLMGFPVALLLAWTYEITSGGIRREKPQDQVEVSTRSMAIQRSAIPVLIACVVLLAWRPWSGADPLSVLTSSRYADSLAVMPVENQTGNAELDHIAVAITDGIVRNLQATGPIKVTDPYSAAHLADEGIGPREIAQTLGVQKIVRPTLFERDSVLVLSARVVDGTSATVLWTATYPGGADAGFDAAGEIASSFVADYATRTGSLSGSPASSFDLAHTSGHDALLRGTRWLGRRTFEGIRNAQQLFGAAIDEDPEDAQALAALSKAHALALIYRYRQQPEGYDAAGRALYLADRAIELDPDLSDAHAARGYIASRAGAPVDEVAENCRTAIELDPNAVDGLSWCARVLQQLGWNSEALDAASRAIALDPLNAGRKLAVAYNAIAGGDYDEAVEQARSAGALAPGLALPPLLEARALLLSGRPDECLRLDLGPHAGTRAACLYDAGQREVAFAMVDSLRAVVTAQETADSVFTDVARAEDLAVFYAWTGDPTLSLTWLEEAFVLSPMGVEARTLESEIFDGVRGDADFRTGLERIQQSVWERVLTAAARTPR